MDKKKVFGQVVENKKRIQPIKTLIYKSPKIHNFSNWSEHRYCQELRLFPCILLFELDQEKVFGEGLGRKVAILVYENIN